jgi:hypothetical protein
MMSSDLKTFCPHLVTIGNTKVLLTYLLLICAHESEINLMLKSMLTFPEV